MPVTDIQGSGGSITNGNAINGSFTAWSATVNTTTTSHTPFSTAPYPKTAVTEISISGSATGIVQYDAANTNPLPALTEAGLNDASITLTAETGCTIAFTATISNVALDRPSNGDMTITFDFQSDGDISGAMTWDEA